MTGAHRGDQPAGFLIQAVQAHGARRQLDLAGAWLWWWRGLDIAIAGGRHLDVLHVDEAAYDLRLQA